MRRPTCKVEWHETTTSRNRQFPEPTADKPGVVGVDVHRDGLTEVGFCIRCVAQVSTTLTPEVESRRAIDRVGTQLEIAAPALFTLLMVASRASCHSQVEINAPA